MIARQSAMKLNFACSVGFAATLLFSSAAFGGQTKTYQVTGPILEINDSTIVVEKEKGKDERWEIARDSSTKADGEMKVGDKVTITYRMTATKIEAKGAAADNGAKAGSSPTASPAKK
jgi:hypothetical protein